MRKHDVRKWLHAVLDLLPVILIPVFMIYSHRHTIDSGTIDVPQNEVVDFNQQFQDYDDEVFQRENAQYTGIRTFHYAFSSHVYIISVSYDFIGNQDNTNFVSANYYSSFTGTNLFGTNFTSGQRLYLYPQLATNYDTISDITFNYIYTYESIDYGLNTFHYQLFDLTQMFGSGNEPTLEEFNALYPNDYYDYTLSHKELLKGTSTITYDDTDIMSQVVYQLYNSVDKYFNMGNVFNMTGVYDWFNLNIFNGNAPISIYIVWNIVLYEFVMDLLFLLYGLFMWFIDMVEKLMEKPLKSVK